MIHVKHGSDFDASSKVCGQAEVCTMEMKNSILYSYSQTDAKDILQKYFSTAMDIEKKDATKIHRLLAKKSLKEEFESSK